MHLQMSEFLCRLDVKISHLTSIACFNSLPPPPSPLPSSSLSSATASFSSPRPAHAFSSFFSLSFPIPRRLTLSPREIYRINCYRDTRHAPSFVHSFFSLSLSLSLSPAFSTRAKFHRIPETRYHDFLRSVFFPPRRVAREIY